MLLARPVPAPGGGCGVNRHARLAGNGGVLPKFTVNYGKLRQITPNYGKSRWFCCGASGLATWTLWTLWTLWTPERLKWTVVFCAPRRADAGGYAGLFTLVHLENAGGWASPADGLRVQRGQFVADQLDQRLDGLAREIEAAAGRL